jgi:hypothetical protein
MTATSPRGGRRDFPATFFDGNSDVDSYIVRDALANNALHCADEALACHYINWTAVDGSLLSGNPQTTLTPRSSIAASRFMPITVEGPFSLPVWSNFDSYRLRVALRGAATGGGTATFALAITPSVPSPSDALADLSEIAELGSNRADFSTSSSTPAWLTPTPGDLITLPENLVRACEVERVTLDDLSGLSTSVAVFQFYVTVWGKISNTSTTAVVHGLHVAGYVG